MRGDNEQARELAALAGRGNEGGRSGIQSEAGQRPEGVRGAGQDEWGDLEGSATAIPADFTDEELDRAFRGESVEAILAARGATLDTYAEAGLLGMTKREPRDYPAR